MPSHMPSVEHVLISQDVTNDEAISNRYIFHHDLGSGAYATVKRGYCTTEKSTVAIKIILKSKTPKEYLKKFVPREIEALRNLSKVNHPFLTNMKEVFETPNRIFIILSLATGGDLLTYINARRYLKEEQTKKLTTQILFALDHIHNLGIVHRDLKCENLLLDSNENIILSDFGFATQQPQDKLLSTFCGSYAYAAPEILTGSCYNGKATDVWSIGIIMYAMLNGRLPFNDCRPKKILLKIKTQPLLMTRQVSMNCEQFVRNILCIPPDERPGVEDLLCHTFLSKNASAVLEQLPPLLWPSVFRLQKMAIDAQMLICPIEAHKMAQKANEKRLSQLIKTDSVNTENTVNTSSTISEKVKKKYRQLKTWAIKKKRPQGSGNKTPTARKNNSGESSTQKTHAYVILDPNATKCVVKNEPEKSRSPASSMSKRTTRRSSSALPEHSGVGLIAAESFRRSKSCKPDPLKKSTTSTNTNTTFSSDASTINDRQNSTGSGSNQSNTNKSNKTVTSVGSDKTRRSSEPGATLGTLSEYRADLEQHKMKIRRKSLQKGDKKTPKDGPEIDSKYVAARRLSQQKKANNQFRLTASISRYSIEPSFTDVQNGESAQALPPLGRPPRSKEKKQRRMSGNVELDQVRKMQIQNVDHMNKERHRRSTLNEQAILHNNIISLAKSSFPRENYDEAKMRKSSSDRSQKRRAEIEAKRAEMEANVVTPTQISVPSKVHYVDVHPPENNNSQARERVSTVQVGLRMAGSSNSGSRTRFNGITKVNT